MLADKTGSLIATSGRFGAMFAGCSREVTDVLVDYGEKVGVAFQLADDVIDLTADPAATGKTPGTDLREGVPTLPVLLARRAAAEGDADAAKVVGPRRRRPVRRRRAGRAVGGCESTLPPSRPRPAQRWADDAVAPLDGLPDGEVRAALADFAGAVADRTA